MSKNQRRSSPKKMKVQSLSSRPRDDGRSGEVCHRTVKTSMQCSPKQLIHIETFLKRNKTTKETAHLAKP